MSPPWMARPWRRFPRGAFPAAPWLGPSGARAACAGDAPLDPGASGAPEDTRPALAVASGTARDSAGRPVAHADVYAGTLSGGTLKEWRLYVWTQGEPAPRLVSDQGAVGGASWPGFSPDGRTIASLLGGLHVRVLP